MGLTKKQKQWILIIMIGFILFSSTGKKEELLSDTMRIYDDGTVKNENLWTYTGDVLVYNGKINIGSTSKCDDTYYQAMLDSGCIDNNNPCFKCYISEHNEPCMITAGSFSQGEIMSKYDFLTEDIRIKYTAYSSCLYSPHFEYAGQSIPLTSNPIETKKCLDCSFYKKEGIIEIRRYDDFDLSKYVILVDGQEYSSGIVSDNAKLHFYGGLINIDYIQYEPYYSCEIDYETEVVVRDKFTTGSIVTIGNENQPMTLSYLPLKFCPSDLGVLRFSDKGVTDEVGSITKSISYGEVIIVPEEDIYWQVDYITKYVDSMTEKCGVGQAYDTEIEKCVDIASQQIPTQELLYCEKNSDCIIPQQCYDATVQCSNNQCDYSSVICTPEQIINYIEVVETIELDSPSVSLINGGATYVQFNAKPKEYNRFILGTQWKDSKPTVLKNSCPVANGEYIKGDGCYQTQVTWGDYTFSIKNGETKKINDHITVSYALTGKGAYNGFYEPYLENFDYAFIKDDDWTNVFSITLTDIFEINIVDYIEKVMLNEDYSVKITINNNLLNDIPSASYNYKVSKGLIDEYLPTKKVSTNFNSGLNSYNLNLPSDSLGSYKVDITPSVEVLDNIISSPQKLTFGYYVSTDMQVVDCRQTGCINGVCQSDGSCLVTEIIKLDCNDLDCDFGFYCNKLSGNCEKKTTLPEETTPAQETTSLPTNLERLERLQEETSQTTTEQSEDSKDIIPYIVGGLVILFLINYFNKK